MGIRVFEGESNLFKDNKELRYFQLQVTPALKKDSGVEIKLKLNADGILHAEAKDTVGGNIASGSVLVKMRGTFTPERMEQMRKRLRKFYTTEEEDED